MIHTIKLVMDVLAIVLVLSITPIGLADEAIDLDSLSGGMSSDASALITEVIFWFVAISIGTCVIIAAYGAMASDPDQTKKGIKGTLFIVAVIAVYYMAKFAITYLRVRYG